MHLFQRNNMAGDAKIDHVRITVYYTIQQVIYAVTKEVPINQGLTIGIASPPVNIKSQTCGVVVNGEILMTSNFIAQNAQLLSSDLLALLQYISYSQASKFPVVIRRHGNHFHARVK
jgi:hypothetical protein